MLIKETTLQSATPGTRNAKIIAVSAMAPDCQRIMIAMRIARSNWSLAVATLRTSLNESPPAQGHLTHRINGCLALASLEIGCRPVTKSITGLIDCLGASSRKSMLPSRRKNGSSSSAANSTNVYLPRHCCATMACFCSHEPYVPVNLG